MGNKKSYRSSMQL